MEFAHVLEKRCAGARRQFGIGFDLWRAGRESYENWDQKMPDVAHAGTLASRHVAGNTIAARVGTVGWVSGPRTRLKVMPQRLGKSVPARAGT
jgi:hypothetical protein